MMVSPKLKIKKSRLQNWLLKNGTGEQIEGLRQTIFPLRNGNKLTILNPYNHGVVDVVVEGSEGSLKKSMNILWYFQDEPPTKKISQNKSKPRTSHQKRRGIKKKITKRKPRKER